MLQNDKLASEAEAITPSDTVEINAQALYVGGAGNVAVVTSAGSTVVFAGVPAGTVLPITVRRVNATNTTATSIVALR